MSVFLHDMVFNAAAAWLIVAWVFILGSAIGSFLNVVAYRLPLGMNLSRPGSRCPACERPIRWYHNVPIAGWLVLRGRCADCGAPISPRYPLVESIVALASGAVAWAAIAPTSVEDGVQLYAADPVLVGYQLVLVWTLLCAALLEFDGNRPPLKLLLVVLAIGFAVPVVDSQVRPLLLGGVDRAGGFAGSAMAAAAAALLAALAWPLLIERPAQDSIRTALTRGLELVLVGVFLGTKTVAAIAVVAAAVFFFTRLAALRWPRAGRFAWAAALVAGTLVGIVAMGPRLADRWQGSQLADPRELLLAAGAFVAVLAIAGRALGGRTRPTSSSNRA